MNYYTNRLFKWVISLVLIIVFVNGTAIKIDAASKASKTINSTYGKITGQVLGSIQCGAKNININAKTTKKVPRLMTNVDVQYYKTGKLIGGDGTDWEQNSKYVARDVDMSHFKNVLNNNKKDGFLKTKLTAYGCSEAIVKKAYTVYTSCVY